MKNKYSMFLASVIILLSFSVIVPHISAEKSDEPLKLLFTHDLHSNLQPFDMVEDGKTKSVGGYARLSSAIKAEREKNPESLLIDAGDYSMGTLFQTINTYDNPELRLMGQIGYDVTTFGNHEYDYRPEGLAKSLHAAIDSGENLPEIVASNTIFPTDDDGDLTSSLEMLKESMDDYGVSEYTILERSGVKIGLFGLMGEEAADDAPMSEVEFEDIVTSSKSTVDKLKEEDVDLVIALSHSGTVDDPKRSEDELLAKEVADIDVIISGHSHTVLDEPILVDDTIIVSSGEYGKNLGILDITEGANENWEVAGYEIKPIDDQLKENPEIAKQVEEYKEKVHDEYLDNFDMEFDEVLAHSPFDFMDFSELAEEHAEKPLGNLIGDSYIHTVQEMEGSDYEPIAASVVPVGIIRKSIVEGDITVSDVFNISPLGIGPDDVPGYPLVDIYLTGKELKAVAEVDASVTPLMPEIQLFISGLSYHFNPNRLIFNKVTDVKLENPDGNYEEIDDDKMYRLVSGLYSAQMLPLVEDQSFGLLSIVPKTKEGTEITDFEQEVMYQKDGNEELKEWFAFASYLESFDEVDGVAQIPDYYQETHDRKIVNDSSNIIDILKNPNGIALIVYSLVLVITGLVVLLIVWIVKRRNRKKRDVNS